jgi:hypothetical protein
MQAVTQRFLLKEYYMDISDITGPSFRGGLPPQSETMTMRDCFACAAMQAAIAKVSGAGTASAGLPGYAAGGNGERE